MFGNVWEIFLKIFGNLHKFFKVVRNLQKITTDVMYCDYDIWIRLDFDKHFKIKISDRNFTQCFDVVMTSLSSDKKITVPQCYIPVCGERCDYSLTYLSAQPCNILYIFFTQYIWAQVKYAMKFYVRTFKRPFHVNCTPWI